MSDEKQLVTKREALEIVADVIDRPGILDVPQLIDLLVWQSKLTLWLLKEKAAQQ